MNILFIHQNFPGQFIHLSAEFAKDSQNRVVALGMNDRPVPAGVQLRRYNLLRPARSETHPLLLEQESHVLRAEACASAAFQLHRDGFTPDVIIAHPGWGEALFIKDVFPQAKLIIYCEYYYALEGQDVGFDPESAPLNFQQKARLRLKNTTNLLSLEIADAAISPTAWQRSTYPSWAHEKIHVVHDGINDELLRFNPHAKLSVQNALGVRTFTPKDEVFTYVARNLEPVRGFHMFMRTLPEILAGRPKAHAIVVGGDEVSYGHRAPTGLSWREHMLQEVGSSVDLARVHFVGKVPYSTYLELLSISSCHLYWSTPFVLSWSFLEAATAGIPTIASDTQPVREFAEDLGISLVPFFDKSAFASQTIEMLRLPPSLRSPKALPSFDHHSCVRQQKKIIAECIGRN